MKKALIFWFTGLSGAGKTTVATGVNQQLDQAGYRTFILDGDEVRKNYHSHLGFSPEDIRKNNALIVELCRENQAKYDVILVHFYEIYIRASLSCVMERDVKGLYTKAKQNQMDNLIGFSAGSVYELPPSPDCLIDCETQSSEQSIRHLYDFIVDQVRLHKEQNQAVK